MSDQKPNYWAENFIYGMDPKFVMAITAKVNMVLHGDGSAHIFKYDGLRPLSHYEDDRLKPLPEPQRVIPKARYDFDVCEKFDAVISNPPFGITIPSDTRAQLTRTYSMRESSASEAFFLERWFQLLKPGGRLGVVVPESLLNTADAADVRLFLYRCFIIKAIVAMPRNIFVETPTLTSLVFAEKKDASAIEEWDRLGLKIEARLSKKVEDFKAWLRMARRSDSNTPREIEGKFLSEFGDVLCGDRYLIKKGRGPVSVKLPQGIDEVAGAANYYLEILKMAAMRDRIRNAVFKAVSQSKNYEFPVFMVDEVGYKLSKRKEKARPNELIRFRGKSGAEIPNLHLNAEEWEVVIDTHRPDRVADYVRSRVTWAT